MISISSAGAYDEKVSTCFDLNYFYRNFDKHSDKLLHVETGNYSSSSEMGFVTSDFEYSANFIIPSITMRLSIFPTVIQKYFDKVHLFPYMGIGGGYGLGIIKYTRVDDSSFLIEGENYSNSDIEYKTHFYGGFHYKILGGLSYKISSKAALIFEMGYQSSTFEQFLNSDEKDQGSKKEKFEIDGICPSLGLRFGLF